MKFNWKANLIAQLSGIGMGIGFGYTEAINHAAKTGLPAPSITTVAIPVAISGVVQLLAGIKAHYSNPDGNPAIEPYYKETKEKN